MTLHGTGLLAYGDAPGQAVQWHVLLRGVQTDRYALLGDALLLTVTALYLIGVWHLRRRGRPWSPSATAAFVCGMATIWIAVASGVAAYDEVNVAMHVLQHVLLMMLAAPLVAIGKPITLASQVARRPTQVRILKVVHSWPVALLTFPVTGWFLYFGSMYVYFLDRHVYDYSINHVLFHYATHVFYFTVGYLYWQPLIGGDPTRWRLSPPGRILATFIGMPFDAFLGIALYLSSTPIDPGNTLGNTRAAGQVFWVVAMTLTGGWIALMAVRWYQQVERQTPREDRQAERLAAQSAARAAELGVEATREGWTIPPWRLAQLEAEQAHRHGQPHDADSR